MTTLHRAGPRADCGHPDCTQTLSTSERADVRLRLANVDLLIDMQMTERGALKPADVAAVLKAIRDLHDDLQTPEAHLLRYAVSKVPGGTK